MHKFKQHIITTCRQLLQDRLRSVDDMMKEITDAANNETKSSAGDKHETGRAMMQIEQEKLGSQVMAAKEQLEGFEKYDFTKVCPIVAQTSLIETTNGYFFIATSLGKLEVDTKIVFIVSNKSPIALAFLGKQKGDCVLFNGVRYDIISVE